VLKMESLRRMAGLAYPRVNPSAGVDKRISIGQSNSRSRI
jgi:hypothetical protein